MRISFVLRELWEGIRGNLSMVLSIVLVSFVSLSFVAVAALLQVQVGNLKNYWYDKAQIAIYLCNDFESELVCEAGAITQSQQIAVAAQLKSTALAPYIDTYYFESQEEAYQRLLEESSELSAAQYLNPEQLNATYWVSLADPESAELVVEAFESQPGVASVADQRSYFDPIIGLLNGASVAAGSIAAVMLFSAALLTATTIRLSAFARRKEIAIMRLVGASSASIQLPFILEGLLAALAGGGLAIGLNVFLVENYLTDSLALELAFANFVTTADVLQVAPFVLSLGAILAVLASGISTFRHLRT
ncbi:MAG: FtsX-like permease family protein [Candidatus Aquiluna sp.]|nr:FtsX-like permease family protein [Aquiluna sp.]